MSLRRVKMAEGGTFQIPADFQHAMGIRAGDTVIVELESGELRLRPISDDLRGAQEIVRGYNPQGRSMVDDLLKDRRAETDND